MRRELGADLFLATSSDVIRKLLGYVVLATLARMFSKADMGELFFAITFASVFALLTDLGTSRYLTRKVAQDQSHALSHVSEVLSLRLPAAAAATLLLSAIALLFMRERAHILIPVGVFVLVGDLYYSFGSLFLGLRRLGYRFMTGLIDMALLVPLVLIAARVGWDLSGVLICYVVSKVALVVTTALVVRWRFGQLDWIADFSRLRRVASESRPFFLLMFLGIVYLKVDTLMLLFLRSPEDVAQYEAGYKFFEISRFLVRSTGMVFFPLCAQLVGLRRWATLDRVVRKLWMGAAGAGAVLAIAVIGSAQILVPAVWGDAYHTSVPIVRTLFVGVPFLYLSYVGTFVAQALHLERKVVQLMVVAVLGNIALNLAVIPNWGALGAAWTTVAGESLLAAAMIWTVARGTRRMRHAMSGIESRP